MIEPLLRSPISGNSEDYREAFLGKVHELLQLGYLRLTPSALVNEQEPAITGELVRGITEVLDDPHSEEWVRLFSVHDDPPVDNPMRKGKHRRRVDIRVDSAETRPRSRLSFEAKRLSRKHPVKEYFGPKGAGLFLASEYGANDPDGGMLGYVQCDTADVWAQKLAAALIATQSQLDIVESGGWADYSFPSGPEHCFRTIHARSSPGTPINLYHTLFQCC
jgi:hypothetical protein